MVITLSRWARTWAAMPLEIVITKIVSTILWGSTDGWNPVTFTILILAMFLQNGTASVGAHQARDLEFKLVGLGRISEAPLEIHTNVSEAHMEMHFPTTHGNAQIA